MTKFYVVYGIIVILIFSFASYQGYAFSSLFGDNYHNSGRDSGSTFYHK